jgi:hypothetical protein
MVELQEDIDCGFTFWGNADAVKRGEYLHHTHHWSMKKGERAFLVSPGVVEFMTPPHCDVQLLNIGNTQWTLVPGAPYEA